jgi:hypothetical protein
MRLQTEGVSRDRMPATAQVLTESELGFTYKHQLSEMVVCVQTCPTETESRT